ncbi:hypothetical protein Tcan_14530 [Toxocara canis]|uniref:Uncharacterized protein n=1 Tax=Toxocara canis TaxID=6265 RepID=A0A0B2V2S7_TOXCA|nr:hypothetical protein Tcan_14530 [Toxocara canis]
MSAPIYTPFVVSSTSCVRSKSAKASAGVTVGGQQGLSYGAVLNAEHMQHSHTPSSLCNTIHDRSIRPAKTQNGNGLSYGAVLNAEHMQHSHTPSSLCNTIHDRSIRPAKTQNGNGECLRLTGGNVADLRTRPLNCRGALLPTLDSFQSLSPTSDCSLVDVSRKRSAYEPESARIRPWEGRMKKPRQVGLRARIGTNSTMGRTNEETKTGYRGTNGLGDQDDIVDVEGVESAYEPESARIRPWEGRMKKPRQVNGASGTTVDMDTVCGYRGTNGLGDQDDIVDVEGVEEPPIGRVTEGSSRYLAGPLAEESPPISNAQRRTQVTRLRAKLLDAQNELKKLRQCEYRWARTDDENKYLKEELELAYSRIRELEALLLHRNAKLKNVLSENLMKTVKLNRLKAEVGEDVFEMC